MQSEKVTENLIWAVATLLFGVVLLLVPAQADWVLFDKLVSFLAAFGTVAAVIVALYLARQQRRDQLSKEVDIAMMHAAGIETQLVTAVRRLRWAIDSACFAYIGDSLDRPSGATVSAVLVTTGRLHDALELQKAAEDPAFDLSPEQVAHLAPLPNRAAAHLFCGLSIVRQVRTVLRERLENLDGGAIGELHLEHWGQMLNLAIPHLELASSEIEKAARTIAPKPRGYDFYSGME